MKMQHYLKASWILMLVWILGCSSQIPTYPVTGKVSDSKGKPIEGAAVSFLPDSGDAMLAVGITDSSGVYRLNTQGREGARAGAYKVSIAQYEGAEQDSDGEGATLADPYDITDEYPEDYDERAASEASSKNSSKNMLPARFADASTSGLTATVVEGENTVDFSVASK